MKKFQKLFYILVTLSFFSILLFILIRRHSDKDLFEGAQFGDNMEDICKKFNIKDSEILESNVAFLQDISEKERPFAPIYTIEIPVPKKDGATAQKFLYFNLNKKLVRKGYYEAVRH